MNVCEASVARRPSVPCRGGNTDRDGLPNGCKWAVRPTAHGTIMMATVHRTAPLISDKASYSQSDRGTVGRRDGAEPPADRPSHELLFRVRRRPVGCRQRRNGRRPRIHDLSAVVSSLWIPPLDHGVPCRPCKLSGARGNLPTSGITALTHTLQLLFRRRCTHENKFHYDAVKV